MTKTVGAVLFPNFELLDLFGPLEMFGSLGNEMPITAVGEVAGPVRSFQGVEAVAASTFADAPPFDVLLLPGGWGTFEQRANDALLGYLRTAAESAEIVMTVCSGSALLSRTGLLDGRRATTNKAFFAQCSAEGPAVDWVKQARWVEDGKYFTSSGVSAGTDLALAIIARLFGEGAAEKVAIGTEYEWHRDSAWDPFAKIHGLA